MLTPQRNIKLAHMGGGGEGPLPTRAGFTREQGSPHEERALGLAKLLDCACPFWRFPFDAHRLAAPTRLAIASATAEARRAGFLLSGDLTKVRDARLQHTGSNPIHQSAAPTIIPQFPSWCLAGCPLGPSC